MYECFHCGARAVIWDADFSAEDYGIVDPDTGDFADGIVQNLHCENCGADIQYVIITYIVYFISIFTFW